MNIIGVGKLTKEPRFNWYRSEEISVPVLQGNKCRFLIEGYDDDENKQDFHDALRNFLSLGVQDLKAAEEPIFEYYTDVKHYYEDDEDFVEINSADEVWAHIQLGHEILVSRRYYGDKQIYISVSCNCNWEEEHGLLIVFRNGLAVNKIGPYDGHVTNSDAYADVTLENVIYKKHD